MVVTEAMKNQQQSVSKLILTGRIYNHKKIREKFPDALLVSVMRKPWRYTPRDIVVMKELGPPEHLLSYVKDHKDAEGQSLVNLQAYYAAEYFKHLYEKSIAVSVHLGELMSMMENYDKIVLLCSEKSGEFCHRHLLRYHLVDDWDLLNGGEIVI